MAKIKTPIHTKRRINQGLSVTREEVYRKLAFQSNQKASIDKRRFDMVSKILDLLYEYQDVNDGLEISLFDHYIQEESKLTVGAKAISDAFRSTHRGKK